MEAAVMASPTGTIEFVASHRPTLLDGEYVLVARQQVQIDSSEFGWGKDKWTSAPSSRLQFAVAGPRFSLDPSLIQSQYPPPKSIGAYYNVLPHVILTRTTLPWERTIALPSDRSPASTTDEPPPWLALVLLDKTADHGAPDVMTLTVNDLLTTYGQSATPLGAPEFVKILPREAPDEAGALKLEVGQHPNDRLTVIDVPKKLLWQILPSAAELGLLCHIRRGQDASDPTKDAEYPVILCNRLPAPGNNNASPVGTQSTVHLISLEARGPLLDAVQTEPNDNNLVRLISLASWSFSTLQRNKTFTGWIKEAWCPDAERTDPKDPTQPSDCAGGAIHTLRMPASDNNDAERFLAQGYAPIKHQTRQGNHLISWYRSPLLPGRSDTSFLPHPVRNSDELARYFSDIGMFDTTYAAAWELGRLLTLRSKDVSISLFRWKRVHAHQVRRAETATSYLPFAPERGIAADFPQAARQWFDDLLCLKHVPFHYLVPREEMLPVNSLRFFHVDATWLECLLDGAFSVGRVSSADVRRDALARKAGNVPSAPTCSGFLLRSPVVTGWPNLGVEAYAEVVAAHEATEYVPTSSPAQCRRFARLGEDVLFCLFDGEIQTIDIHEHPETVHFGVDVGADPTKLADYTKELRKLDGTKSGVTTQLTCKHGLDGRALDIAALALAGGAKNSAEFGVTMIEGVEKVRFIKQL
jgi:hypothetical protein